VLGLLQSAESKGLKNRQQKKILYVKQNCFLRSMIFQNAKLNKRKFNNCDFFSQNSS